MDELSQTIIHEFPYMKLSLNDKNKIKTKMER